MKTLLKEFNFIKLNLLFKKNDLLIVLNWTNDKSWTWINFLQTDILTDIVFSKTPLDLYKGLLKKSLLKNLNTVIINSLILGSIQKSFFFNVTIFLEKLPTPFFILFLKLNKNFYSIAELQNLDIFNYFKKILKLLDFSISIIQNLSLKIFWSYNFNSK